jgi:catechol 2,3-dioxygenase-like lactoylglutathione lyase family enzyme
LSTRAKRGICFLGFLSVLFPIASTTAQDRTILPPTGGIDHVLIYVSDLKKAREFYGTTLGLTTGGNGCRETNRSCFTINWAKRQYIELEPSNSCPRSDCLAEVVLVTKDAEKLRTYLVAHGLKVTPIAVGRNQSRQFHATDPEGNPIGFVQFTEYAVDDPPPGVGSDMRIIHAGFVVHDRAAEDRFYKDILGFHVYWHGGMKDDETNWVDMQVPDGTEWIEYMLNVPANANHHTLGVMNHIALGVPDIHAAEQQLIKNGWKGTEEPKIGRDGKWQLNLYDPDQTRVELMEFTPVEKPCCSEYTGPHPKQ